MPSNTVKYRFNAKNWRFYLEDDYVHLPGILLKFLYFLSFTVESVPFLPFDQEIEGRPLNDLRKRFGKLVGHKNAQELIECISGYGYRFNPELFSKNLFVLECPPKDAPQLNVKYGFNVEDYHPYSRKRGGYQASEEDR